MKKIALVLVLVLAVGLVAAACGEATPASPGTPAASPEAPSAPPAASPDSPGTSGSPDPAAPEGPVDLSTLNIKRDILYATNPVGSGNYTFSAAHAAIWGQYLNTNVTVEPTTGAEGVVYALESHADLGIVNGFYAREYWMSGLENSYDVVRVLFVGEPLCFSFITNAADGIETVADLRGKRVTYVGLSQTHTMMAEAMLAAYGLTEADVIPLPMSSSNAGLEDLAEGRTDAVIASVAGAKMDELAAKIDAHAIEFNDPAIAARITEISDGLLIPAQLRTHIPGSYVGANLMASVNQVLVRSDVDDDTAYALTRVNLENTDELAVMHVDLQFWDAAIAVTPSMAYYPYHAGAIRYFKEAGLWTDEAEAWQNAILAQFGQAR